MPSIIDRLRQRKLFQWALAYIAGAWVVLQVMEVLAEPLSLSPSFQLGVLVVVVAGFFVALVLAWYHGEKGQQRVSGSEALVLTGLFVAAAAVLSLLPRDEAFGPGAPDRTPDGRPGIAVLPCENFSPNADDAYLAAGIHEEILTKLSRISGLFSIGRESVEWYRDHPGRMAEMVSELGVGFIGECSIRKDANRDRIRLTFQLLDSTGVQLWAENYDRDLSVGSLLEIQSDVAQQVAQTVSAALTPEDRSRLEARPTDSDQAYQEYMRGVFNLEKRTAEGFSAAEMHLTRAIELDSTYAAAYAKLADSYSVRPLWANADEEVMFPLAEHAAQTALRLDPESAEAHAAYAVVLWWAGDGFDPVRSEEEFRHAIRLNPSYAGAHNDLGVLLSNLGRHDEAIAAEYAALRIEPYSWVINISTAYRLWWGGRHDAAIDRLEHLLSLYPDGILGAYARLSEACVFALSDRVGAAGDALSSMGVLLGLEPAVADSLASVMISVRRTGVWHPLPAEFGPETGLTAFWRTYVALLFRDHETALDLVDPGPRSRSYLALPLTQDPMLDPLRDDPRFQALVDRWFGNWRPTVGT